MNSISTEYSRQFICKNQKDRKHSGKLIAFEGCDGVGKSTLVDTLTGQFKVLALSSPISSITRSQRARIDEATFEDPNKRFRFYTQSNVLDSRDHLLPNLSLGKDILLDRYVLSTITGNLGLGMDLSKEDLSISPDIVIPDATIFLYLPEEERIKRVLKRFQEEGKCPSRIDLATEVQRKVAQLLEDLTGHGLIKIDVTGLTREEVATATIDRLKEVGIILTPNT